MNFHHHLKTSAEVLFSWPIVTLGLTLNYSSFLGLCLRSTGRGNFLPVYWRKRSLLLVDETLVPLVFTGGKNRGVRSLRGIHPSLAIFQGHARWMVHNTVPTCRRGSPGRIAKNPGAQKVSLRRRVRIRQRRTAIYCVSAPKFNRIKRVDASLRRKSCSE